MLIINLAAILLLVTVSALEVAGQQSRPAEDPAFKKAQEEDLKRREALLHGLTRENTGAASSKVTKDDREIQKKAEEWIAEKRKISLDDLNKYAGFLNEKNTGIFKLFPNFDCESENIRRFDGPCVDFVPDTSDYSFRKKNYTGTVFYDIELNNGQLISDAFLSQGILVSFGGIPIEDITATYPGLSFLTAFQSDQYAADARKTALKLRRGVQSNGLTYSNKTPAAVNITYGLRAIAYGVSDASHRTNAALRRLTNRNLSVFSQKLYDAEIDKRKDILVVFRIVRLDSNDGLTIIWKELDSKKAPDLKFAKDEIPADFKP